MVGRFCKACIATMREVEHLLILNVGCYTASVHYWVYRKVGCKQVSSQVSRTSVFFEQEAYCAAQVGAIGDLLACALHRPLQVLPCGSAAAVVALQRQLNQIPDRCGHLVILPAHIFSSRAAKAGSPCLLNPRYCPHLLILLCQGPSMGDWRNPHKHQIRLLQQPHCQDNKRIQVKPCS